MAVGAAAGPPFDACLQLTAWALEYAPYLRGRLLFAGTHHTQLGAADLLDATHTAIVELADRPKVLDALAEQLARPALPTRERWGRDPQAVEAQRAMMAQAPGGGGPARKRSPDAKRPEAWKHRPGGDDPT